MISVNDQRCKTCTTSSHSCEENKRRFEINSTLEERKNLRKIKVDGCVYNSSHIEKRCDYIFIFKEIFSCFIELKGKDIKHAVAQLETSLQNFEVTGKKHAFIVASANEFPSAKTDRQRFEKMFKKNYNCSFDMKNIKMSKQIEDLIK
ncbi:MAG: hypothetical protein K0R94_753 [Burkholderiales bacterium]|jgi:hypothetical protein|nr:hypothetical protein [Burkholderiales bacterium]